MKILQFVKGLLPSFEKSKVTEDLRVSIGELDNIVNNNFRAAADHFKVNKLQSDSNKDMSDIFYQNFDMQRASKQANFIAEISRRLDYVKENAQSILESIENLFERDIIAEGLTAKKALLVRTAESISFISRFSIDLLNFVYVNEAMYVNAELEESMRLSPAGVKFINAHMSKYSRVLSDLGIPNKDFEKIISSVPEVIVNSKTANSIIGLYKEKDIDPFSNSYMSGFTGNPVYHIRLLVSEWQANRYKSNKDKKKMLELRLLHLKLTQDKKNDPKVEQEINYIQSRVDKIDRYLREVEDSLDIGD